MWQAGCSSGMHRGMSRNSPARVVVISPKPELHGQYATVETWLPRYVWSRCAVKFPTVTGRLVFQ